jgi:peptidoglycan/LPS O-acetylase OafA/YrhL
MKWLELITLRSAGQCPGVLAALRMQIAESDGNTGLVVMNRTEIPAADRVLFFDSVRNLAMLSVVLYHAVAAYSTATPHWSVHDGSSLAADGIRHLFDVFMMPLFFFVAGYFTFPSLTRQGTWKFLEGRFRRIGVPWLLAILLVIPMSRYSVEMKAAAGKGVESFWQYWFTYLSGFGTLRVGLPSFEVMNQMHFWFLSLLLAFSIVFCLFHAVGKQWPGPSRISPIQEPATNKSILTSLFAAMVLASLGYFVVIRLIPETSWITIDLLLQLQPSGLVLYVACFSLGALAFSRQWFRGDAFPGRLSIWVPAGILLAAGFLWTGRSLFTDPSTSYLLSPGLLLSFSFARTSLCLAALVIFIAFARKYRNGPSRLGRSLAANSYNIYLVHIFWIITFQNVLMLWKDGPAVAKAGIVFLLTLPPSYGISRLIDRFPRGFATGLLALFILVVMTGR